MAAPIRSYIAHHLPEFKAAYSDQDFKAKFGAIQGEKNKRLPAEFQQVAAQEPLIANKQFYYSAELPADFILQPDLADVLMEHYLAGKGVNQFLIKALKGQ